MLNLNGMIDSQSKKMSVKKRGYIYSLHPVPMNMIIDYQKHEIGEPFIIELKAPREDEKFLDDHKHFTKSNINVCYAAPRNSKSVRNWYETQLCVSKKVRERTGYPFRGMPLYAVTDDGYGFLAHTTSQGNKQFAAVGDELILGKWIKGRLVAEGLVQPIENVSKDKERHGMITREMLEKYGCNSIAFQQTDMTMADPEKPQNVYEVWTLKLLWSDSIDG